MIDDMCYTDEFSRAVEVVYMLDYDTNYDDDAIIVFVEKTKIKKDKL